MSVIARIHRLLSIAFSRPIKLYVYESACLDGVEAVLPAPAAEVFRAQRQSLCYGQRMMEDRMLRLGTRDWTLLPASRRFPNTETAALGQVTLRRVDDRKRELTGRVWINRGQLIDVRFGRIPCELGFGPETAVEVIKSGLLVDPIRGRPIEAPERDGQGVAALLGVAVDAAAPPPEAQEIANANDAFDRRLPGEYLQAIALANGFRRKEVEIFALNRLEALPCPSGEFVALGLLGERWLGVDPDGRWATLGPEDDDPQVLDVGVWEVLRGVGTHNSRPTRRDELDGRFRRSLRKPTA